MPHAVQKQDSTTHMDTLLHEVSTYALYDEVTAINRLLEATQPLTAIDDAVRKRAGDLIAKQRSIGAGTAVEAFLQSYGLSTKEGIAMLCLAEALLRIPDHITADALIEDTFKSGNWKQHLGQSESTLVNAGTWGLMLTGEVLKLDSGDSLASWFGSLVKRSGEPVIRQALRSAMGFIGQQFVMGEDIADAIKNASKPEKQGYMMSYDILGEGARTQKQATAYVDAYIAAIGHIGAHRTGDIFSKPGISVKLSALHPRYSYLQRDRVFAELLPRLKRIVREAMKYNIAVSLDAEEANRLDLHIMLYHELLRDPEFASFEGIGFVLQAYQKRAFYAVDALIAMARETGHTIPVRLVKGAYWDSEIKAAQVNGLSGYPVFTEKFYTDLAYLACAQKMLAATDALYPQFATHNALTVATIIELAKTRALPATAFEFQRLHGMGESLHDQLLGEYRSRIYAPVGEHKDLLAYLIRRLLENGANTSFVHLLLDQATPIESLTESPITQAKAAGAKPNPDIPLPEHLYSNRKNSGGFELGYRAEYERVTAALAPLLKHPFKAPKKTEIKAISALFSAAKSAQKSWDQTPVTIRAGMLRKAADLLESEQMEWVALLQQEGKKTIYDAVAEIREAADFCRYYALHAEALWLPAQLAGPTGESNVLSLHGRGVFVCISPWNFPLAIFMGQAVAALVAGNTVLAKPAEQTSAIAAKAVEILHAAGIPKDVVQLVCGDGETVGAALIKSPHTAGVCFTGSTYVAKLIQRALAEKDGPIIPLIAETGGQNVMVVDSSALLEQAVDDIITSAFGSAGQRCSALRCVFVQEDIAPALRELLIGAMDELRVGDPQKLTTEIGPVIDEEAQTKLNAHIKSLTRSVRWHHATPVDKENISNDTFVVPHVLPISKLSDLEEEHFGPVLHFITYKAKELPNVIAQINDSGYGLTFGLHTRLRSGMDEVLSAVHVGNRYVNRSMIGAVVGVQPFGGEGLSGTGPKAGGPYYLLRFAHERTTTINTAAIGGNVELLS
jgi:RHH-type proline utilization regulon transcriptional repressor/proline dehydrogenase/delta 1-pyrroline-5-carboxylate dehydrogenase